MKQKVEKGVKADTVPQVDKLEVIWVTGEKLSIEDLRRRDTAEILEKIQPPELRNIIQLLLHGRPGVPEGIGPIWAKLAATIAFKWFVPPKIRSDIYNAGWLFGIGSTHLEALRQIALKASSMRPFIEFLESLLEAMRTAVFKADVDTAGDFFDGARDAQQKGKIASAMPHNTKCLFVLGIVWPAFDGFTMERVHRKFQEWRLIAQNANSRQTRALLRSIQFPAGRAGRPRKKNPA